MRPVVKGFSDLVFVPKYNAGLYLINFKINFKINFHHFNLNNIKIKNRELKKLNKRYVPQKSEELTSLMWDGIWGSANPTI